jgi:hypothetical protein
MHWLTYVVVNLGISIPGVAKTGQTGHFILTNVGTLGMQ